MMTEESFRLHKIHCRGCSEYSNHMGARGRLNEYRTSQEGLESQHEGFDSPPPPPHTAYGQTVTNLSSLPTMSMLLRKLREQNGLPPEG